MNPVFIAKLSPHNDFDNNGRYQVASNTVAPGALPRVSNAPGALPRVSNAPGTGTLPRTATPPAPPSAEAPVTPEPAMTSEPVVVASVPMPRSAPQPKQGEAPAPQPTTIARLFGNLFGGSKAQAAASTPLSEKEPAAGRSANTDLAAKPKQVPPVRTASATASAPVQTAPAPAQTTSSPGWPAPKPSDVAPKAVAETAGAPAWPAPSQPAKTEPPRAQQPEIRTAYSTPPASNNGLLAGAQPVVPAGTFSGFR
jgi:hypothetical protein